MGNKKSRDRKEKPNKKVNVNTDTSTTEKDLKPMGDTDEPGKCENNESDDVLTSSNKHEDLGSNQTNEITKIKDEIQTKFMQESKNIENDEFESLDDLPVVKKFEEKSRDVKEKSNNKKIINKSLMQSDDIQQNETNINEECVQKSVDSQETIKGSKDNKEKVNKKS